MTFLINAALAAGVTLYTWVSALLLKVSGPKKQTGWYQAVNIQYNLKENKYSFATRFVIELLWTDALFIVFESLTSNSCILYGGIVLFRMIWITVVQLIFLKRKP